MIKIGQFEQPAYAFDVQVTDSLAFVSDADVGGVWILNISNPSSPNSLSHPLAGGIVHNVHFEDNLVYAADWLAGLKIINVSNPLSPLVVGSYVNGLEVDVVTASNDLVCIGHKGYSILNVSNPALPSLLYESPGLIPIIDLELHGNLLFYVDLFYGLNLLNITNPSSPSLLDQWSIGSATYNEIAVVENIVFIVGSFGLYSLDFSDPFNIVELDHYSSGNPVRSIDISNSLASIIESESDIRLINISNPTDLISVGHYSNAGSSLSDICITDNLVFTAAKEDGLLIFEFGDNQTDNISSAPYLVFFSGITIALMPLIIKKKISK